MYAPLFKYLPHYRLFGKKLQLNKHRTKTRHTCSILLSTENMGPLLFYEKNKYRQGLGFETLGPKLRPR